MSWSTRSRPSARATALRRGRPARASAWPRRTPHQIRVEIPEPPRGLDDDDDCNRAVPVARSPRGRPQDRGTTDERSEPRDLPAAAAGRPRRLGHASAVVVVVLALMTWTSWGRRKALCKCLAASVAVHCLAVFLGGTTRVVRLLGSTGTPGPEPRPEFARSGSTRWPTIRVAGARPPTLRATRAPRPPPPGIGRSTGPIFPSPSRPGWRWRARTDRRRP